MTQTEIKIGRKKLRINIKTIDELEKAMKNEGYDVASFENLNIEEFKSEICNLVNIKPNVAEHIYFNMSQCEREISYRSNNVQDFLDYMEKITEIKEYEKILWKKICKVDKIHIDRIEYDRKPSIQEDVEHMINAIKNVKNTMCGKIDEYEKLRLYELETGIDENYIYAKDIELLKKMIIKDKGKVKNTYDEFTCNKRIYIDIPENMNSSYIKPLEGSIEYHEHISRNIPRIKRLIKNLDKYMKITNDEEGNKVCEINQSKALQDSINIAVAVYNQKEFKAVSGSDEVDDYCVAMEKEETVFESCRVNRLGKIGIGYNRFYDSEKKILEEIHKQIEEKKLDDRGNLVMYSRWEPCPSCYYVISQFCSAHPQIEVSVKFDKSYGE